MTTKRVVHELTKAVSSLQDSLALHANAKPDSIEQKAFRDASIQRFEYCLELAWKTSMRLLGQAANAAKPAVREMARNNLIQDPSLWISFVDARNNTSHSHDEDVAKRLFAGIKAFLPEVEALLVELQKL